MMLNINDERKRSRKKGFLTGVVFPWIGKRAVRRESVKLSTVRSVEQIYQDRSREEDFYPIDKMPESLLIYTILLEDRQFYRHPGMDLHAILRDSYLNLKLRRLRYGASTITQQLCKNLYFGFKGTIKRKIKEFFITFYIESKLTKDQILELYLNIIYFGNGKYGINAASQYYFGVEPADLSINQAFSMMCMLPFPGVKNPIVHPHEFCTFKLRKAANLYRCKVLSPEEYDAISNHEEDVPDENIRKPEAENYWYAEHVPWYNEKYGPFPEITEDEKMIICTVSGEAYNASSKVQKAVAHVIMNRIGHREWRKYKTAEEIIKYTGFDAYDIRATRYVQAEKYLQNRNGLDEDVERVICNVVPVIRGQEEDFTGGCVLFYSPMRYMITNLKRGKIRNIRPDWNYTVIKRERMKGCRGDFAFYRYTD